MNKGMGDKVSKEHGGREGTGHQRMIDYSQDQYDEIPLESQDQGKLTFGEAEWSLAQLAILLLGM